MEINKLLFEKIKTAKIEESFEELDINSDGKISEIDLEQTQDAHIKEVITAILDLANEDDNVEFVEEGKLSEDSSGVLQKSETSTSARGKSNRSGLPLTDLNTFEEDVLNSKGTVFLYIGNQQSTGCSFRSCEELASKNLSVIQNYANIYHLDVTNSDLVSSLWEQAGLKTMRSEAILKFVDGKFVETISQSDALNLDTLLSKVEGEPSKMPDIAEPYDQNPDAPRNEYGIKTTNTDNFEKDVLNSKGTVYVTIGNLNTCCKCKELQSVLQQNAQTINALATVYDLSTDTDKELCWQIYRDMGGGDGTKGMPLPQVAKFVDGKFVQLVPLSIATGTVSNMIKLAEGSAKKDADGMAQTSAKTFDEDVKKSKGTSYVIINSAEGCQYCNYLHNELKKLLPTMEDIAGIYELYTNEGADRELCWQIYRDMGGGDGTKGMPLPQIAKFVDGEFVELLTNIRDYGTPGLDNATIKEMIEKAEGKPVNNITSNNSEIPDTNETEENADISATEEDDDDKEIEKENSDKTESTTNTESVENSEKNNYIKMIQKMLKQIKKQNIEKEISIKQEELEKLQKEINNTDNNEYTTVLNNRINLLSSEINNLSAFLEIINFEIQSFS